MKKKNDRLDKDFMNLVVQRLKSIRKQKNILPNTVFKNTGFHIGRLETQPQKNLSISSLKKLCDFYDMSLEEFFEDL